jgi:hypothetical protein
MPGWAVIVLPIAAVALVVGLLWLLIAHPELGGPIQTVAAVAGTGLTAFAAWSAYKAAQVSQGATIQSLRTERRALQVERAKLVADNATHEHWSMVEKGYQPGSARDLQIDANLVAGRARLEEVDERLSVIAEALGDDG